ncbi:MAG: prephenate dehydratase [Cytophagales bacterium]
MLPEINLFSFITQVLGKIFAYLICKLAVFSVALHIISNSYKSHFSTKWLFVSYPIYKVKVAIQGFTGSFHAIATEKYFGASQELVMCNSFVNLFKALDNGEADCAVMAIENTIAGTILFNYSLLRNSRYQIIGETFLRIEHCLLALPNQSIEDITEVRSHPMALMQCIKFFGENPSIRLVEAIDTAYMAELIAKESTKGVAAIAGEGVAEKFGLQILKRNIEDSHRNFTRFLVLSDETNKNKIRANNVRVNKATLSFSLAHEIGGLSKVMNIFAINNMNVMTFTSTPYVGSEWEYFFHTDILFDNVSDYKKAIAELKEITKSIKVLGEYENGI